MNRPFAGWVEEAGGTYPRKRVLVKKAALILLILPIAVFADWGIGGAAFYKSPELLGLS